MKFFDPKKKEPSAPENPVSNPRPVTVPNPGTNVQPAMAQPAPVPDPPKPEPFKPEAKLNGIDMATSFEGAIEGAELVLLLVKHSEFVNLKPEEVALKTQARVLIDCVNGWIAAPWENAGFTVFRLGVNNAKIISQPSQI